MRVSYSYLSQQFANPEPMLEAIRKVVQSGDFTLGQPVREFEERFAKLIGTHYAVGVGSGTDALFLSLKAIGVQPGDEVITAVNTFVATAGAIHIAGARIVFVDCNDKYVMDVNQVARAITPKTKAIVPVHYAGQPVDLKTLMDIAGDIPVIEDACQGIDSAINGKKCGTVGITGAFSLHPLKNLNVWGDGGVITTNSEEMRRKLQLLRNHGMKNRDEYEFYAYNSRLDSIQAGIGNALIEQTPWITEQRIRAAKFYDETFQGLSPRMIVPPRSPKERCVYHLYMLLVERRDELLKYLNEKGIEAKIHYPIPLHLQPASAHLGYKRGDFPVAEAQAKSLITLPVHQHLTLQELDYVAQTVHNFYKNRTL